MSKWNRPMRRYHSAAPRCAVCGKPMTASVFDSGLGAYRHLYDCLAPKGRPTREVRERLRKAAGL